MTKIGDQSDYGWSIVQEYEADDLASGSEEKKRLEKAERAAEQKAAKKCKTAGGPVGKTTYRAFKNPGNVQPNVATRYNAGMTNHQTPGRLQISLVRPPPMVSPCYFCGEMGHLGKTCATALHSQGRWYPGNMLAVGITEGSVEFVSNK